MQQEPIKIALEHDLKKLEDHEWHLWSITLTLLILFVGVFITTYLIGSGGTTSGTGAIQSLSYNALPGLFILTSLFCIYVLYSRVTIARMRSLLVEMSNLATSNMDLESYLSAAASMLAKNTSATLCQIALLNQSDLSLRIRSVYAEEGLNWHSLVGKTYALEKLNVVQQVLSTLKPVFLRRKTLQQLPVGREIEELLGSEFKHLHPLLILPMVTKGRVLGLLTLGGAGRFKRGRFSASKIVVAQALAGHAATAIEQSNLETQVVRDPLTNLYNRRHFTDRIHEEITRADRNKHVLAVLLCDLDRFKAINDTQGHQVGDAVLTTISKSILESTRGTDLVFRWGGDEIVVVLSKTSRDGSLIVAERIQEGVQKSGENVRLDLDISIGIVLYPEHGNTPDDLIRVADRALYIAKKSGEKIHVGEEEYRLDEQSIKVVFQPIVDVWSDQALGYEALARDPHGKLSVPELFKKYNSVGQLHELKKTCFKSQIQVAQEVGLKRLFINADFEVISQIDPIPKPPGMDVVIELSELEALHDLSDHLSVAENWRKLGYKFAIDDFGAGFISLPFIARFVPDYIKVDRSTMLQAVDSEKFRGFLKPLLQALRTYSAEGIIAEGVEQEKELEIVKEMGIFIVQGFLFGKPQEMDR
jgi:diguanylate cyclase (GGDEF)-like protein